MKILIVVDMQNDFIDGVLGSKEAQAIVPNIVNKLQSPESNNTLVLFTKDTHYDGYLNTQEGKNLPIKHCIYMTGGWSINKEIASTFKNNSNLCYYSSNNIINNRILKNTFASLDLAKLVENFNETSEIEEIELVGVCTDICVISNAMMLKAFCPEIPIVVDASCCAGVTPERHLTALNAMEYCQIKVINKENNND